MAIQVWTPFTADRSILAGGMEAAGAIGGGIHKLGDGITQALERQKQKSSLTTTLRKKLSILQPERKDEFNTMGLEDLTGEDLGHAERILRQRQEQEMESRAMSQALQQREMQRREAMEQREMQQQEALPRLYKELGETGQAPESVPAPVSNEEFDRRTAPRDVMTALARSGAAVQPDDAARLQMAMEKGQQTPMLGPEALKQFGFVPTGGQVNPNGSASLTFGPPPAATPTSIIPIPTKDGGPSGKGLFGDKLVDIQAPNAEGKTLTQSENQMIGALNQAGTDLDNLEKIFKKLGPDWGGPVSGRAKNAASMGQSPDITAVENAINAATPNLARGVFREVGVLTDEDIKRYKALLPTAYDTDAVRKVKMDQLRERIVQGKKETMDSLRKAGRDLSGFDKAAKAGATKPPANAAGKSHEQLIQEANAAIQGGANEKAVRQRLKELGVEIK